MDSELLKKHISKYIQNIESDKLAYDQDKNERKERSEYYRSWTPERIVEMTEDQFYEFLSSRG